MNHLFTRGVQGTLRPETGPGTSDKNLYILLFFTTALTKDRLLYYVKSLILSRGPMKVLFSIFLVSFVTTLALARTVPVIRNCATVERAQLRKGWISQGSSKGLSSFKGVLGRLRKDQLRAAQLEVDLIPAYSSDAYFYELKYLGKKYDAINFDADGSGRTTVFLKNTLKRVNFYFMDGDMYVGPRRCAKVVLPGDVQF